MKPEELLHLFAPYLPTDRFRALLRNSDLPSTAEGAALMADISGFTPLTGKLVEELGAQRAVEELNRRVNPMFEAIAGQVFIHGGSVIRFTGDGFIAWFDDSGQDQANHASPGVPAFLRAVAAGLGMQAVMPLFKGLRLKVCVGGGQADRWVLGQPEYGLVDVLSGPAVEAMSALGAEAMPGQVMVHNEIVRLLDRDEVTMEIGDGGNANITTISDAITRAARSYRWPAWSVSGDIEATLNAIRPFVAAPIRAQIENGFGDFVAELRTALPMFIQFATRPSATVDLRRVLDDYVSGVQRILTTTGGRLVSVEMSDKGNVLFIVFGVPITYGDDAVRALRAALNLREMVAGMEQIAWQRIGLSRGLLYAGTLGGEMRHEYSTIGEETNIAARLMSVASMGQVLVSTAVRREVGTSVVFEDLPPVMVKGRAEPVSVTTPLAIHVGAHRQEHSGQFVGREPELAQLKKLLKAVKLGLPRIVRVEGQSGIGKSRLIAELTQTASAQDFRVAGGDCVSTGQHTAYLPWHDILLSLLSLEPDSDPIDNVGRIQRLVEQLDAGWLARLPLLGDLLDLPIEDSPLTAKLEDHTRRQALFAFVTDLIMHLARRQPTVLIIEDTQWIDEISEALTVELAHRLTIEPVPLMLILIHRPSQEADHPPELIRTVSDMQLHTHIVLGELNRADANVMIEKYLGIANVPPELARFIYDRTQGNPFFVQEVIDTLRETGFIEATGSQVSIIRDLQAADLPQTVQGLIQARIDRLRETEKMVLKVAAVIGRQFQVRVLAGSIPVEMSYDELLERLHTLEEHDFSHLYEGEPDLTYLFRHAITQEVTYQSLPFAQRRQLHRAVAQRLEVIMPDETERLAYHFARSGDDNRARHYLVQAGQKALRDYANQAALGYFTQVMELLTTDRERFEIGSQRLKVLLRLGDMQGVRDEITALQDLANRRSRQDWAATIHLFWAEYYAQTSAWPRVIDETQKAIAFARRTDSLPVIWDALLLQRDAFLGISQREEAESVTQMMKPIALALNDERRNLKLSLMEIEDISIATPEAAVIQAAMALDQIRYLADPVLESECLALIAGLYLRGNDFLAALETCQQQIALLRQIGDRRREGLTLNQIGSILINLGQLSEANVNLLDAYKILHHTEERAGESVSLVNLGIIAYYYKAYDEALAYMQRGLAIQRKMGVEVDAARTLFYIGNAQVAKNDLSAARTALNEAREFLLANNLPQYVDEVLAGQAEISLLQEDNSGAHRQINQLLSRLEEGQFSFLVIPGLAYWRAVRVLEQAGEAERAAALRKVFRERTAKMYDRLEERGWQTTFISALWYHADLLGN